MILSRRQLFSVPRATRVPASGCLIHVHRPAMACRFEVTVSSEEPDGVEIARWGLDEIGRLEDQLTIFRETSEVSSINRSAASQLVPVEGRLFDLLHFSRELYDATEGAFDITSGPLSRCWGFLRRSGRIPTGAEIEAAREVVGMSHVVLDPSEKTVHFTRPGVQINLGSIGKGHALDRVREGMRRRGVGGALLNGGSSSMLAFGQAPTGSWPVGIRDPRRRNRRMALLRMRDCGMATSGIGEQFFEADGKRYGHILDPRTGWPAEGTRYVTVVAPSATEADALATAFFVGGRGLAERYTASHPEILVIMIEERDPERPVIVGNNTQCEVEWIHA